MSNQYRLPQHDQFKSRGFLYLILALTFLAGFFGAIITKANIHTWYFQLTRPPGSPPNWIFAPVWTILYVLMAVAAWRVWRRSGKNPDVLNIWFWQLFFNALWTPVFFGLHQIGLALIIIVVLDVLVIFTICAFAKHDRVAATMLLPYLLWICYATYLNLGYWWLNEL